MSARDDILGAIRARNRGAAAAPERYTAPAPQGDLSDLFAKRAGAVATDVRFLASDAEIPGAIAELLRARNMELKIHLPTDTALNALVGDGRLTISAAAPGPDDTAVAIAPFAIAETGTLVYPAREASPASWHFRPGFEIAILREGAILAHFEDVLARLKEFPTTINLVTGPSRTGDIEQTLELGAHGPKALAILIVRER